MSTDIVTVPKADISVPWRTQYVSASLNEKMMSVPRGVLRGFLISPTANNDEISLDVDPVHGDSILNGVGIDASFGYAITYRTTSAVTLDLSGLAAARYYIYFVNDYAFGANDTARIVAYTEAEFEAGQPETDGGLFICAAITSGNVNPFDPSDLLVAGVSTTTYKAFLQETMSLNDASDGPRFDLACEFRANDWDAGYRLTQDANHALYVDNTDFVSGSMSMALAAIGAGTSYIYFSGVEPLWNDSAFSSNVTTRVIVQFWYKTDGSFTTGGYDCRSNIEFYDTSGSIAYYAHQISALGDAPTYADGANIPDAVQLTWTMLRYEVTLPILGVGSQITGFRAFFELGVQAGTLLIGGCKVFTERQPGQFIGDMDRVKSGCLCLADLLSLKIHYPNTAVEPYSIEHDSSSLVFSREISTPNFLFGTYGNPTTLEIAGDNTSSSYFYLNNVPQIRHSGNSGVLEIRTSAGANSMVLDVHRLKQTDNFTYSSGSAGAVTGDTPTANVQYAGMQVKAWGQLRSDGAGSYTLVKGFNVSNIGNSAGDWQITFATNMADSSYTVLCSAAFLSGYGAGNLIYTVEALSVSGFQISVEDSGGAALSIATASTCVMFAVYAEE